MSTLHCLENKPKGIDFSFNKLFALVKRNNELFFDNNGLELRNEQLQYPGNSFLGSFLKINTSSASQPQFSPKRLRLWQEMFNFKQSALLAHSGT